MTQKSTPLRGVKRLATLAAFAASPLLAQSSDAPSQITDGLSDGTVVEDTRQVGDTYVKEEFSDWSLRCITTEDGNDPCQMYQLLQDEGGSAIAEFTMFRLPEGSEAAAGATIVAPLETALEYGLTVKVDEAPAKRYPFAFCNTVGCYARIGLTAEEIEAYKRGAEAVVQIVPIVAQDQVVQVKLSLSGFTAAYEASTVLSQ